MKIFTLAVVLLASLAIKILAEPVTDQANASRYRGIQYLEDDVKNIDQFDKNENLIDLTEKDSASSGRFFMRKFLFSNIFGQKQPIVPIIITGVNTDFNAFTDTDTTTTFDTGETPTDTITNATGDAPTNTETDSALTPTVDAEANPTDTNARNQFYRRVPPKLSQNGNKNNHEDIAAFDTQTMATAVSVGAKSNRPPAPIILRRGNKRDQVIRVRIPAKYRDDFQNDQFVIINANRRKRPLKRRVIRKRKNRRRNNKNKNRRRRITAP